MITGLTKQDVELCNLMWSCDSLADVERMITALPPAYKARAQTLQQLMVADQLDEVSTVDESITALLRDIAAG
jgi:hypothetical protein